MGMMYPLVEPAFCKQCGAENKVWDITESGPGMRASCPQCGAYIKFVSKKDLDLPARSVRSSTIKPQTRFRILARDGMRCVACGRSADDGVILHVDHIIPVQHEGDDDEENLITLCEECNLGKSDNHSPRQVFLLWLQKRGRVHAV